MASNKRKKRVEIPATLAAEVQFHSDRTCCVCRVKGKPYQLHHIDDDPSNNTFKNLAVLCFDCHNETQISGGFHRKLNAEQVTLYRDDWLVTVAKRRAAHSDAFVQTASKIRDISSEQDTNLDVEIATSIAEIYHEQKAYDLLAMHYLILGNEELRDKYIELAIKQGVEDDTLIFYRKEQGHMELVPSEVKERYIEQHKKEADWLQLGRLYRDLEDIPSSVEATCKGIIEQISNGRFFTAAIYLKEMIEDNVVESLFIEALKQFRVKEDIFWQYRALQELGWHEEKEKLLLQNAKQIEESGNLSLLIPLALALGDMRHYAELLKEEAREEAGFYDVEERNSEEVEAHNSENCPHCHHSSS